MAGAGSFLAVIYTLLGICILQVLAGHHHYGGLSCSQAISALDDEETKSQETMDSDLAEDTCVMDNDEILPLTQAQEIWKAEGDSPEGRRHKRKVVNFDMLHPGAKWDKEEPLTYYTDEDFDQDERDNIDAAMKYLSSQTCFDVEYVDEEDQALIFFVKDASCLTFMGKVPAADLPHIIYLNKECTNRIGEILHYVLHALGFWHEQQRPDRDDYVTIVSDLITSGEEGNSFKISDDLLHTFETPYDLTSIMHYKSTQFSKGGHTIEPKGDEQLLPYLRRTMGQRAELSFFDRKQINLVYCPVPDSEDCERDCENGGYPNPRDCTECVCPDGFGGATCDSVGYYSEQDGCGGILAAGVTVDYITSLGYGTKPYDVGVTCSWSIEAPEGEKVKLWFEDEFGVFCRGSDETCYNWVEIRLEEDLTTPGVRFCCGTTPDVELVTRKALIIFKSRYEAKEKDRFGFKLAYSTEAGADTCRCKNGGVCEGEGDDVSCKCPEGFKGETCEWGCGTCAMPARTVGSQTAPYCTGYRETEKLTCGWTKVSYKRWWSRRIRYKNKWRCIMEPDIGVGPYCGCGYELYDDGDELYCAMVGWGEWKDECECHAGDCAQSKNYFYVMGFEMFGDYWCGGGYYIGAHGYRDCPDDMECEEPCHHHHVCWWWC